MSLLANSPEQLGLSWFQAIFFGLTVPVITANFIFHRQVPGARLGWIFLWMFVMMQVIGHALMIAATTVDLLVDGIVISTASLSPLYYATFGIWREVAHNYRDQSPFLYGWRAHLVLHLAVAGGIAMIIAGVITQFYSDTVLPYARPIEIIGIVLLLIVWLALCGLYFSLDRKPTLTSEKRLLSAVGVTLPLLGLRTVYSMCAIAIDNDDWNYFEGPPTAQILMQVLPTCLIVVVYGVAGLLTRSLAKERQDQDRQQAIDDHFEGSEYPLVQQSVRPKA